MNEDSSDVASAAEKAMSIREQSLTTREELAQARGKTADQRDDVAEAREQEMDMRETLISWREKIILQAESTKAMDETLLFQLRQANEHLVVTTIQSQQMTEQIQKVNDQMGHLAHHDPLTGLPNRILLKQRLLLAIALAQRRNTTLALLFLDLDNFKHINDSLGHEIGDQLLQSVAQRLTKCVRNTDTISRQGGDEFVILLPEDNVAEDAALTAKKIVEELSLPHFLGGHEMHVTTSIGISIYPEDAQDTDMLIKNADTAMYQAKAKGRNNYQFFKSDMNARAVERQILETHLRHAIERKEFVLHYQAKVNLESGVITGAEALLRWMHPEWGMVMPDRFVSIAEDCGLIVPIGRWVLREACEQAKCWDAAGLQAVSVAINLSALEFRHHDFVENVHTILRETGLAPNRLQLEITESVLMNDVGSSTAILNGLKHLGVELAVDDFGTGYSSLSYLKQFPIDVLKIDQSFVQDLSAHPQQGVDSEGVIVSAIIALGTSLKQRVIAEGVEAEGQLAFLKARGCVEGQGFFFSPPLSAEQFAALLATGIPGRADLKHDLAPGDTSAS
jgi:diguanylate cyclase (GGDEF)-like protein